MIWYYEGRKEGTGEERNEYSIVKWKLPIICVIYYCIHCMYYYYQSCFLFFIVRYRMRLRETSRDISTSELKMCHMDRKILKKVYNK